MARPRYRPKLPTSLQAAEHDAYVGHIAGTVAEGGLSEVSGVDVGDELPSVSEWQGNRMYMIVAAIVVAGSILALGLLIDM